MTDPKSNVRYLGFHPLPDGSRRLDFSFSRPDKSLHLISVEASHELFTGPDQMAIQECVGICYETLKFRLSGYSEFCPASISLTRADVAQHRKPTTKSTGYTKKRKQS
jgi:hypothetical protein